MAKRSRNTRRSAISSHTLNHSIARPLLRLTTVPIGLSPVFTRKRSTENAVRRASDRRRFTANQHTKLAITAGAARLNIPPQHKTTGRTITPKLRYAVPERVGVCLRRRARREVLFALQRTGAGSNKKRRGRNSLSNISCR